MTSRPSPTTARWAGAIFLVLGLAAIPLTFYLMKAFMLTSLVALAASFLVFVNAGGMICGGIYSLVTGKSLGFGWKDKTREEKKATLAVVGVGILVAVVLEVLLLV